MSNISYNTKILFENREDSDKIFKILEAQRFTFNECSKVHFGAEKNSVVELHAKFYRKFRNIHPEIPAEVVVRAINEVLACHRSIKSNKHKIFVPVEKKNLSMRLDKHIFSYKNEILKLSSMEKRVKCKLFIYPKLQNLLENFPICDPLLFVRDDEIWISLTFKLPDCVIKENSACGVDLGIKNAVATSEGAVFKDKKFNARKRKLRFLKRKLQSKGSKSARRHLTKLRHKERNANKNQSHKIANWVLDNTEASVIAVEDLTGIKNETFKKYHKNFNNKWSQVPVGELIRILEYKALLRKKKTVKVNPRNTSKRDSRTGELDGVRFKGKYMSVDGKTLHSDVNAAINIANLTKLPLSGDADVRMRALLGQVVVNRPTVCQSSPQGEVLQTRCFSSGVDPKPRQSS